MIWKHISPISPKAVREHSRRAFRADAKGTPSRATALTSTDTSRASATTTAINVVNNRDGSILLETTVTKRSSGGLQPRPNARNRRKGNGECLRSGRQFRIGFDDREPALALHVGARSGCTGHGNIRTKRDHVFSTHLDGQSLVQLPQKGIMLQVPSGKGDEDDGASGFTQQPDFRTGGVLLCLRADAVVRIEENDIRAVERAALVHSPGISFKARRHWLAVEKRSFRPNRRLFERSDAAFWQRGKTGVKLRIKQSSCRFVAPFQMPSIRSSIVTRRVIPRDAERPIRASQST